MRQSQWETLLIPAIYHHFLIGMNKVPSMRATLFNILTSKLAEEKGTGIGGISPDTWNLYKEQGQKGILKADQLYTQSYVHDEYPARLIVQKKLLMNDQYEQVKGIIRRVGISAEQKMEIDAASLLNNAFAAGTTWSDGKPLCSDSHPRSPKDKAAASVQINSGTLELTADNVSTTRVAMMLFEDDAGNPIGIMPNELWYPPHLHDTAIEITGSTHEPDSANNAKNPQANRWTLRPWLRLTDANAWFMSDSVWREEVVKWYVREVTRPMLVYQDTTDLVYEFKLHYSYGVDDWRWIYGNNPS